MTVLKLLLVRHGESQGNLENRMEGCSSTPLTATGERQAFRLGQWLAHRNWPPTHIYCSPLLRATATLAAMGAGFHQTAESWPGRGTTEDFSALTVLRADLPVHG
ncbi:MAG TPA: histidine phosphatase family protein, partial [Leptolyngbyaceae cyanobacterium M65_K2018_010]|nr:histidine phosphatase family protein [Leptolyngbyaceae cyanobacterium M65_K2018_010]